MTGLERSRFSRRQLMRLAGLGAVAAAGVGIAPTLLPQRSVAAAAEDDRPETFLAHAYTERERAATTGDLKILDHVYDSANDPLFRFERERATLLSSGLGAAWGGTLLEHSAEIALVSLEVTEQEASARLIETLSTQWIPRKQTPSAETLALMAAYPDKYRDTLIRGKQGDITSAALIPHEVRLLRGKNGWRIASDQHDEFFLAGRSPDLIPGSWAAIWFGRQLGPRAGVEPSPMAHSTKGPGLSRPLATQYFYDWNAAVAYARQYAASPYPLYCNYNCCGGDCTNFVSQCYRQGGQIDQSPWYTFNGGCGNCTPANCTNCQTTCPNSASYAGSDCWANVDQSNTFFTSTTDRAGARTDITQVSTGDYIDYNFGPGYAAGHKTIISAPNGTSTLVCSHSPFVADYPWDSFGTAVAHRFAWMNQYYDA